MKTVLTFLHNLQQNNNKVWFDAHKAEYLEAKEKFEALVEKVIIRLTEFDPAIKGLKAKDCTYRIYRDVRFSSDKSPYKTHMGAYICPGGKKSRYMGYYFHISVDEAYGLNHMIAVGDYMTDPKVLKVLREDIINGDGDFDQIMKHEIDPRFSIPEEFKLKRVPRGFDPEEPYSEYLKMKSYCISMVVDDAFVCAPDFGQKLAEIFKTAKPFLDYVNRAIDYVHEEM